MRPGTRLTASLAVPATIALLALARSRPPPPRPEGAPATEFSAGRALVDVRVLAGSGAARPVGSAEDARAVGTIVARLRALGLAPEIQEVFACGVYGTCATVRNVFARLDAGEPGRRSVLVVAHHDSVDAGPGAADDAASVAALLEIARALVAGPRPARPVAFLFTDGEEAALVGASAFVDRHPAAAEVGAVVNLEARGTSGPSILFDTSGAPPWIGGALAALPRPVTSSLASAVYDLLPNDTDLTVFDRAGLPGVNLAFAFGAVRYHTPRDDVAHLDPASLQHQGENALALVRSIAAQELERGGRTERAWFDVLSVGVVSWPFPRGVALVAALAALLAAWSAARREPAPLRAAAWGVASALAAPLLAGTATTLLLLGLRAAGAVPRPFLANALPLEAAACAAGGGGALLAAALLARRAGPGGLLAGAALATGGLSAALAVALPLATPLAAPPALAFGLAAALRRRTEPDGVVVLALALLPAAIAAVVAAPVAFLLPSILGAPAAAVSAIVVAALVFPAVAVAHAAPGAGSRGPERSRSQRLVPAGAAFSLATLLAAVQVAIPHATADAPERLTFAFHEESGVARWLAEAEHDALPAAVRDAVPFPSRRAVPFPWQPWRHSFAAPAPPLGLPPPRLEVLSSEADGGGRRVRARLSSPRGAPVVLLLLPPSARLVAATVAGVEVPVPPPRALARSGGYRLVGSMTAPPEGVLVELALSGDGRIEVVVVDRSRGLPDTGAPLVAARPDTAVPSGEGDVTVATARPRL